MVRHCLLRDRPMLMAVVLLVMLSMWMVVIFLCRAPTSRRCSWGVMIGVTIAASP